jgi:hypothetical protein
MRKLIDVDPSEPAIVSIAAPAATAMYRPLPDRCEEAIVDGCVSGDCLVTRNLADLERLPHDARLFGWRI